MPAKKRIGVVVSDKMQKTRTVEVSRTTKHPLYFKVLREQKRYYAHDERNQSKLGDKVVIIETSPTSKLKRWKVLQILNPDGSPKRQS